MNLLYKHEFYQEVLEVYQFLRDRQLENAKYPRDCLILIMASCFKLNTPEAFKWSISLAQECGEAGKMLPRKAISFLAMLSINQHNPATALEVLSTLRDTNYITTRNLKLMTLSDLDRVDDVLPVLRFILERDYPDTAHKGEEICQNTLNKIREAVDRFDNKELTQQFEQLEQALKEGNHVSKRDIEEVLCVPILEKMPPRDSQVGFQQTGQFSQGYRAPFRQQGFDRAVRWQRGGLADRYDT